MTQETKRVAIIQSNYIPWKGYFDIINMVDEFIFLDDVQYTRRDWRNRNLIKTPQGLLWLTIPVQSKGQFFAPINQISVQGQEWRKQHWNAIVANYSKARFFNEYADIIKNLYLSTDENNLSKINFSFINTIAKLLDIQTPLSFSTSYASPGNKSAKLVGICKKARATIYLSGPAAKNYLDEQLFLQDGIQVEWMNYQGYPEYNQLNGPFLHQVSALDLLFNEGPNIKNYMKSFQK